MVVRLIAMMASLALIGCGANSNVSEDQYEAVPYQVDKMQELFNGKTIAEEDYPAVYTIGGCTATFVSDSTMITASHCVSTGGTVTIRRRLTATSIKVVRNPKYASTGLGLNDTAVVLFPEGTSEHFMPVSSVPVEAGDEVLAVGYGCTNGGGNGGVKRAGTNKVSSTANGTISLRRSSNASESGLEVTLCPGDSGGPLFKNNALVGIASFWDGGSGRSSGHANVTHPSNTEFFKKMVDTIGADIPYSN